MRRAVIALAAAAALLGAAPAAHARTDDLSKPVLLVAGPERGSCGAFDDLSAFLAEYTIRSGSERLGPVPGMETIGFGADCSHRLDGARAAEGLATYIAEHYKGKPVDVVAEGGGGLVIRSALHQRPSLKVEDVVTLGTDHAGSTAAANPQGAGGTDWSLVGSDADTVVPAERAVGMEAAHKTVYAGLSHDQLLSDVSQALDAKVRYSHGGQDWVQANKAAHPAVRVARSLAFGFGDGDQTCGLAATQPDQCGVTPVIMVPGFGASVLECTTPFGIGNLWPSAITNNAQFYEMALGREGVSPLYDHACAKSSGPSGAVLQEAAGQDIHKASWAWIQRIAAGHAYQFGWDFRKGPDQSIERLDQLIDKVRALHGVSKVAIVSHSYGGLLSRWYIDDPDRAQKVARVANFGSPWWGAPKAWFAMAYGYETPDPTPGLDWAVNNDIFRVFTRNLAGLYYLFPPQAWFEHAPELLRSWLEIDEKPVTSVAQAVDAIRAFGGNGALATTIARNHAEHIDGFKRNGVDWRTFIGSGLPTLGHVRAWSGSDRVQYSWVNGDGTVPLFSQRQSARKGDPQLGAKVPTYNFCNTRHMGEMESDVLQQATQGFITDGRDPAYGAGLWANPCPLNASQFVVTKDEDAKSVAISKQAEAYAGAARVRARAAAAPMTLDEAEKAGLVDVIREPDRTVFVTTTTEPLTVHAAGTGQLEVTPLIGDAKTGAAKLYDLAPAGVDVSAAGSRSASSAPARAADRRAPRTKAKLRRGKLTLRARDASRVAVTMVRVGGRKARPYKRPLRLGHAKVRYWSVDEWGNAESVRVVAAAR
ncbi:lipase/acyltransferase domain-containing protein [Candidatus Solirubrobacter pratensis]|uniref:lipase/acyltransferase domain-containing protein n=1 Tax=Candidatus Solirubrobacter pratensis TaxID=1298857 RepID=UPI0004126721|nr:hypothetical protein [Candidatus Solirubrobacter pratensis]